MNLPFGLQIGRRKGVPTGFQSIERSRGWWPLVREGFTGAWQRNVVTCTEDILSYPPVYRCVTLLANDVSKVRIKVIEQDNDGIWKEVENSAYSPVLRDPNHFQTRIQFIKQWMLSKLIHGNTYVIKQRNNRGGENAGNVTAMYVLDPRRVKTLVSPDGFIYYELSMDSLSQVGESVRVPASEIIHDMMPPLYHQLCGTSPLSACGLSAAQGLRVQNHSIKFFENGSTPSGTITMADEIDDDQARDIQKRWEDQFSGNNSGRVAVLGFGMTYAPMTMTAVDSQLTEQLKWTAEQVCTTFGVPAYMVGVGPYPSYNNVEALNQQYYGQTLQTLIEEMEALLDKGLGMGQRIGTALDLDGLLRMDTLSKMSAAEKAIKSGMSPNEVRLRFYDLGKVVGGDQPYFQQQDFSLEALAKRDSKPDPFAKEPKSRPPTSEPVDDDMDDDDAEKELSDLVRKEMELATA